MTDSYNSDPKVPWRHIEAQISQVIKTTFTIRSKTALNSGCINAAYRISGAGQDYFIKFNQASRHAMFSAEADALVRMAKTHTIRIPQLICHGKASQYSYLVLEYLPLQGQPNSSQLARQLAAMHRCIGPRYGWHIDNTIGLTPQINTWADDWLMFWREQRLGPQLALAGENGYGDELQNLGARLLVEFPVLFASYTPVASTLHGDLWNGNCGALTEGEPVLYDPACYYGDRETDLAMTTLFGGFGDDFYAAYQSAWPLDPGYPIRKDFYNLYHVLNHLNLFGGSYHAQAVDLMRQLLSATTTPRATTRS